MKEFHAQQCHISIVNPGAFQMLSQLRLLDLSENQISDLNNTVFSQSSKLATFSAASNLIKNVDNIFNKTRWLQVINLDSNFIEDITNAFTGLFLLNRLRLKQNKISFIRDKTFNSNKDLKYLDLSQNEIEWLGTNCFKGLVRLDHLDLGKNKLLVMNGSTSNLPRLTYLVLDDNTLHVLEENDFFNDLRLRFVNASRNNITSVEGAFRTLDGVRTVSLLSNRLTAVHRKSFPDSTPKLRFLDLNTNLFSNIKPSEIPNHVQVLNIKGNKLSSFPLDLVSSFNLSSIQLTDNPWRCDCEDYPFSQW
ncbi:leucine-rich transmembrane protein, putative, partial [Ixodes scapularis]